jgi:hypothetical protein
MTDPDAPFRAFRSELPDPAPDVTDRVAHRAMDRPRRVGRGSLLRNSRRFVGVAAAAAGAVVLVGAIAGLLVLTPEDDRSSASEGTADHGMNVRLKVLPGLHGGGREATTRRAAEVLDARSKDEGITGFTVSVVGPETIDLAVPGAEHQIQFAEFLTHPLIEIFDLADVQIARSADPRVLVKQAQDLAPTAEPSHYVHISSGDTTGAIVSLTNNLATVPFGAFFGAPDEQEHAMVPRGFRILRELPATDSDGTGSWILVRDEPVLRAGDVGAARAGEPGILELDVTQEGSQRLRAAAKATRGSGPSDDYAVAIGLFGVASDIVGATSAAEIERGGTGTLAVMGTRLATTVQEPFFSGLGGRLDAGFEVVSATPYGQVPPLTGERLSPVPAGVLQSDPQDALHPLPALSSERDDPVLETSVVRVLSAEHKGKAFELYAGRTEKGALISGLRGGDSASNGCYPRLGHPVLSPCGAMSSSASPEVQVVGRATPRATRVEARYADGPPVTGWVENGWFLIFLPVDRGTPLALVAFGPGDEMLGEETGGLANLVPKSAPSGPAPRPPDVPRAPAPAIEGPVPPAPPRHAPITPRVPESESPAPPAPLPGGELRPQRGHRITPDHLVAGHNREALHSRLSHEHTIKGVPVNPGELGGRHTVRRPDGNLLKALLLENVQETLRRTQLPARHLDSNLPDSRGTHEQG